MNRLVSVMAALALSLTAIGCSNKGAETADEIDQQIVDKINQGKIKTLKQAKQESVGLLFKKAREMRANGDKLSTSETDTMNEKLKEYEKKWKKLIDEKN